MSLNEEEFTFKKTNELAKKKCSRCSRSLPFSDYYRNKSKKDGLESYCKKCAKHRNLLKRIKNKKVDPSSSGYTVVFNGFPDEKVFISKLEPLIKEILKDE